MHPDGNMLLLYVVKYVVKLHALVDSTMVQIESTIVLWYYGRECAQMAAMTRCSCSSRSKVAPTSFTDNFDHTAKSLQLLLLHGQDKQHMLDRTHQTCYC